MVEAAVRGIVDFRQARFFDPAWRRRLHLMISGLQDLNRREELRKEQDYYTGLMAVPNLEPDAWKQITATLDDVRLQLDASYRPWVTPESTEAAKARSAKKFQNMWEQKWGKLDDPETQLRIARTAAAIRKQREDNAQLISPDDITADPKKRALARERTGKPRRNRNDAIGRTLSRLRQ